MPTYYEIRARSKRNQKKRGLTKYEEKMKDMHGSIYKLKKLKKNTKIYYLSQISVRTTPRANMNRVISQIKTNAARKNYDADPGKRTVQFSITMIPMKKQRFPVYPSTRKGREGEVLTFEQKRKKHIEFTRQKLNQTTQELDLSNHEIDIEIQEVEDYGDMDSLGDDYE